jgi:Zinc knuckle/Retrotransposon gag protein
VNEESPTKMVNNVEIDGDTYDLDNPRESAAYIQALVQQNQDLRARLAPVQLAPDQVAALAQHVVNAVRPQPARGNPAEIENPVTTARNNRRTFYQYESPPAGWDKDAKEQNIDPWNGTKLDVTPFLSRVEGTFLQRPRSYAYTWQKILYVLQHLANTIAKSWAANVRDAIANKKNNDFYFDDWQGFKGEFKLRFGLRNEEQLYYNQLVSYKQGPNQDARSYTDNFEQLRQKANLAKANAYQYLRGNANETFRTGSLFHPNRPNDYDTYRQYMLDYQKDLDENQSFTQLARGHQSSFQTKANQPSNSSHPSGRYHLLPGQQPMNLDVVQQQKIRELRQVKQSLEIAELEEEVNALHQKKGKGKKPSRSFPTSGPQVAKTPTFRPGPPTNRLSPEERERRSRLQFCFKCAQPGHFARNCPNSFINSLEEAEHKINQLDHLLNEALAFQEEGFEEEDGQFGLTHEDDNNNNTPTSSGSQVYVTDTSGTTPSAGDLIDFDPPQLPTLDF